MGGVEVRILGPVRVTVNGAPVELRSGTQRAILAVLATRPGAVVRADVVAEGVWGDSPPPSAKGSLQAHLSRLRRSIAEHGATDVVVSRSGGYLLDADVDASAVEAAVARGRAALGRGEPQEAARALSDALDRWEGTPLGDVADQPLIEVERARLESLRADAVELWLRARIDLGEDAIADAEALVEVEPLRESSWALLIRALQRAGREAEALRTYERARMTFAEELGVRPGHELRRLHAGLLAADAAASEAAGPPNNLPNPLTTFVGRAGDLAGLVRHVTERRLVTIVGIGGAGKTRLATETARAALPSFGGGAWFVDLTAAAREEQLVAALADALEVREAPGEPLEGRVATVLSGARTLVVLDNCEHVVEGAAALADRLLRTCPRLTILATSREPLAVPGEVIHELGGLELPADHHTGATEAIRLLADRAADAAVPISPEDPAAAEICRRLDGLPLALEIVAPHLRTMPLTDIAEQLEGRFRLGAPGSRVAPDRQRTLQSAIDWSCELISIEERDLLGKLSVFPGSFALDAVAAVCHDDGMLLERLVGRSLVVSEAGGRYRLLETVRAYAREHLGPDLVALRARLAEWVRELAETAEPELTGPDQAQWLDRLDAEHDNLRIGLEVAADRGDVAGTAVPLLLFWAIRGRMIEGEAWLARAAAERSKPDHWRLRVLNAWALALESVQGPSPELQAVLAEATSLADDLGDRRQAAWAECWSGLVAMWNDLDVADQQLRCAAEGFSHVEEPWGKALALLYRGHVARLRGDDEPAKALLGQAEQAFPDRWGAAMCRSTLAEVARHSGDRGRARQLLTSALQDFRELGSPEPELVCLRRLARLAHDEEDLDNAGTLHRQALDLARRAGSATLIPETLAELAQVAWDAGDPTATVAWLEELSRLPITGSSAADGLDLLAALSASVGDPEAAVLEHAAAAAVRERLGAPPRPDRLQNLERSVSELRAELGSEDFDRAWTAGIGATPDTTLRSGLAAIRTELRDGAVTPTGDGPPPRGSGATS